MLGKAAPKMYGSGLNCSLPLNKNLSNDTWIFIIIELFLLLQRSIAIICKIK